MIYQLKKILSINEKQDVEMKLLVMYRYLSLIITSLFYIFNTSNHSIIKRGFIVICIMISSFILNYLYIKNRRFKSYIKILLFIEIIGNSIILIPSGGLNSPFVWYSLNTILITAIELKRKYIWMNLFIYLIASLVVSNIFINTSRGSFIQLIWQESNLILSLILITILVGFLFRYIFEIQEKTISLENTNRELQLANEKIKKSMNHTMKLYHTVELFSHQRDKDKLLELITNYTEKITGTSGTILSIYPTTVGKLAIDTKGIEKDLIEILKLKILDIINSGIKFDKPIEIKIHNQKYLLAPIKSNYEVNGVLGIEIINRSDNINELSNQLKFLTELTSIVLEKFEVEEVNERLLKTEEQNRIANEIHDGVLQRLFSISCGIFTLMKRVNISSTENIKEELNQMRGSIDKSMKELRNTIYKLSWNKDGEDNFILDINNYIDEIKKLNNVDIKFIIYGNNQSISTYHKKAFYRIIREAISNGIRHGKAGRIEVNLSINKENTFLEIKDNGKGFDIRRLKDNEERGIGLDNMNDLVNSLDGDMNIDSKDDKGTRIRITVPNVQIIKREEVV